MALTRYFRQTLYENLQRDAQFRKALLAEAINLLLNREVDISMMTLRDFINGTLGFAKLAEATGKSPKSLMRMFSPRGNPQANNLFEVIAVLQKRERLQLEVRAVKTVKRRPVTVAKRKPAAPSRPAAVAAKRRAA